MVHLRHTKVTFVDETQFSSKKNVKIYVVIKGIKFSLAYFSILQKDVRILNKIKKTQLPFLVSFQFIIILNGISLFSFLDTYQWIVQNKKTFF